MSRRRGRTRGGGRRTGGRGGEHGSGGKDNWVWMSGMETLEPAGSEHFRKGLDLQIRGNLAEAIRRYDMALRDEPDNINILTNKSSALVDSGRIDEALACCRTALSLDAKCSTAYASMGLAMRRSGRPEQAVPYYDKAIAFHRGKRGSDRDLARMYSNKGTALVDMGMLAESIKCYDAAIGADPDYVLAHGNKGASLVRLERFEEAAECFAAAKMLDPDYAIPFAKP